MKSIKSLFTILLLLVLTQLSCTQQKAVSPDLSKIADTSLWNLYNREASVKDDIVHLDGQPFDGLLWIEDSDFSNGKIEVDIKGKDEQGRSFVGMAFHGLNDSTFDAIYFRPFNFENPERNGHSLQYISHPVNTWRKLRSDSPEKYENPVIPVPDPNDWFHATIVVNFPEVKVFVNESEEPSLVVNQLSTRKTGWIGFWVGHGSEGYFRNLRISAMSPTKSGN